jgi:hypothetical protein
MTDILVFSCAHADPEVDNGRFDLLGNYIYDTKPDLVIDLGDGADMRSLNSYDTRYPQAVVSQSYQKDIEVYNDSQERLRHKFRYNKRKRPYWVGLEGNHEHRIKKVIAEDPRREGDKYGISFGHLQTDKWFDEYHEYQYSAPAIASYCGVDFSHYFASGNYGSATSGIHHAYTVINNRHRSSVCGHSHKRDLYFKDAPGSIGMVVGCFKGKAEGWAGQANNEWWNGVVMMRDVENGRFEPQFISLSMLEKAYA